MRWTGPGVDVLRAKTALVGLAIAGVFVLVAVGAPSIAPHAPETLFEPLRPPSATHLLGTDDIGHDLFSELCYGARFSLAISLLSSLAATTIGTILGVIAGYKTRVGYLIMRIVDVFLAIPRFPLIILMAAFMRPGTGTLLLFFTLFGWPRAARLIRSQTLTERGKEYVLAAQLMGARDRRIIGRHLLPSALPLALSRFISEFQHVILAESGLSFLGLGNPLVKSWGMMLSFAFRHPTIFVTDIWIRWALPPGTCITLMVLALALLSYSLDTWANPRLRAARSGKPAPAMARRTTAAQLAAKRCQPPETGLYT